MSLTIHGELQLRALTDSVESPWRQKNVESKAQGGGLDLRSKSTPIMKQEVKMGFAIETDRDFQIWRGSDLMASTSSESKRCQKVREKGHKTWTDWDRVMVLIVEGG